MKFTTRLCNLVDYLFLFFLQNRFELMASHSLGKHSNTLNHVHRYFYFIFSVRISNFLLGIDLGPKSYLCLPTSWDSKWIPYAYLTQLFCGDGILLAFCPGWPQALVLPIATSPVAGTTDRYEPLCLTVTQ
jgi:hypothetical protein